MWWEGSGALRLWFREHRPSVAFVGLFLAWVLLFAFLLQTEWVARGFVHPFTEGVARAAGFLLDGLGERTRVEGTRLSSPRFAVNIYHGCNGVLATSIFGAAVLAFPATWKERGLGLLLGIPLIQVVNMVRILSLYYIGIHWPRLFAAAHGYVWQSIVILLSMVLWIFWAERIVHHPDPAAG
ncbi:MAG: exosortase H [Acidobacteriota bacterium]|jgi:exosortase H (IPTLxxWG-CTERM-specific)